MALACTFGHRRVSAFEVFLDSFGQDWERSEEVQGWMTRLREDPLVRVGEAVAGEARHLLRTTVSATSVLAHTALLPITYPLSKFVKPVSLDLTPCPFTATRSPVAVGAGEIQSKRLNFWERSQQRLKNIGYSVALSRSPVLRAGYALVSALASIPLHLMSEPSREMLVIMAIQRHFPDFNVSQFAGWLERSFLPHLLSHWIAGRASSLRDVAEASVIQERQLQVSDYVSSGLIIHSRMLSVYDVEVIDFDFKGHTPMISVSCLVDHTEDIRSRAGNQRIGGPEEIFASEFLVAVTVADVGDEPVWKANELRASSPRTRI
jgi:hypothetical protein